MQTGEREQNQKSLGKTRAGGGLKEREGKCDWSRKSIVKEFKEKNKHPQGMNSRKNTPKRCSPVERKKYVWTRNYGVNRSNKGEE